MIFSEYRSSDHASAMRTKQRTGCPRLAPPGRGAGASPGAAELAINGPIYCPTRAESGNAISIENPSFVLGTAGGAGCATPGRPDMLPLVLADFVSAPIGNFVTVGAFQARRVAIPGLPDSVDCIIRLRGNRVTEPSMATRPTWQDQHYDADDDARQSRSASARAVVGVDFECFREGAITLE
jgi:hypothetical protein